MRYAPLRAHLALAGTVVVLAGCASAALDHDVQPVAAPLTAAPTPASSASAGQEGASGDWRDWEVKWRALQSNPEAVSLKDHWTVCELKFRFRIYGDLLRCAELVDERVARLNADAARRNYTLVLTGWMRASAYTELGDLQQSRSWLDAAWAALPEDLRNVDQHADPGRLRAEHAELEQVFVEAGADATWGNKYQPLYRGESNLAKLDLRPEAIAMSLAAQRSVVHQQLGETEVAQAALADLRQWLDAKEQFGLVFTHFTQEHPYAFVAEELSIGPYYAQHDDARVIAVYESVAKQRRSLKSGRAKKGGSPVLHALARLLSDVKEFDLRLEDASDDLLYASSLAHLQRLQQAKPVFDRLIKSPETRSMGSIYWAALYGRGEIALAEGKPAEALGYLQQAADAIERVRSTITLEGGKIGFAADKQAVYAELVRVLARSGDWQGAYVAMERAKARALVDMLAQNRILTPPTEADARVRALLAQASATAPDLPLPAPPETVAARNLSAEAREELATAAPQAASLVSVPRLQPSAIAAKLAPDETLVDYFVAGDEVYAAVVTRSKVTGEVLAAPGLAEEVRAFRAAIEARSPETARDAGALYDQLLRRLAPALNGTKLTISPHQALHYLPWAALADGDQQLIDRYALRIEPSASTLIYIRSDVRNVPGRLLAFGNPDLGDPRYDLPGAEREARRVAAMFPASRALLRKAASKSAVKDLAGGFAMLHFASHGVFDPAAPLHSGLMLARGTEPDGLLTVADLYTLHLNASLVTLSACETGLGQIESGDDVIGLTRGFLYAGAQTIIASLWSVQDEATANLMTAMYSRLDHMDKRQALREAQLEVRRKHPEPLYWAAFQITGSTE